MKTKLAMMVAMAAACAAVQLAAMPTEKETRRAEPVVRKLLEPERKALRSGKKTRSEVADAAMKLAAEADTEAAKLLLMKGAFVLYVQDGKLEKAVETMNALEAAIADMPPQSVTNMIETALLGVSKNKKIDAARLYKLLDAAKVNTASRNVSLSGFGKLGSLRSKEQLQQMTVDGYTWLYLVRNGEARIVTKKDGKHSCAVSPTPTGDVSIPSTLGDVKVTSIGWEAFRNCKGLTSVTIPEGVTHIDWNAFCDCRGLKSVTLPSSLKIIGWGAFVKCEELTSVIIPEGVTDIGNDAFNSCSGLKSVVIPNSVTNIGDRAFICCRELTSVTIPAKVARIGEGAFGGCSELRQINVAVGNHAFTLIDGVLYTKDVSVLLACPGTMTSVTIPSGVTKIGAFSFRGCNKLTSVTISESVTNISTCAFQDCSNLKRVTMLGERPEASEDIFKGWGYLKKSCDNLTSIHVPANAKSWAGMKEWQGIPLVFDGEARAASEKTLNSGNATSSSAGIKAAQTVAKEQKEKDLYMIVDLTKTGKRAVSYLDEAPRGGWSDEYRTKKIALRKIAPGSFEYLPGKSFTITKPFYIGVFEITQKQYEMVMKVNPSEFKGDMRPVEKVSYIDIRGKGKGLNWPKDNQVDADSYLGKLRKRIGIDFDLPTEVQWEYACRAGTKGNFNVDGVEMVKLGKCRDNGGQKDNHVKVGSFLPNAWGLYDMHGNVWEWCLDRGPDGCVWMNWTADAKETDTDPKGPAVGASRLHRGGGWWEDASSCRIGRRPSIPAGVGNSLIGLRLACPAK